MRKIYFKGYKLERKVVNQARAKGYISFRSAGSHSPIDLVIVNHKDRKIELVQCKAGESYKESFKDKLAKQYEHLNGVYEVSFKVVDRL